MLQGIDDMQNLLSKLAYLSLEYPSRGGPYVGITHNDVTRAIVAKGDEIVPLLMARLDTGSLTETIFLVFCLRELQAKEAKGKIQQLQPQIPKRFPERDLTLDTQVQFFLRDVDSW